MDRADEGLGLGLGSGSGEGEGEGEGDGERGGLGLDRADEGLELLEVERAGAILVKLLDLSLHLFKTRLGRV